MGKNYVCDVVVGGWYNKLGSNSQTQLNLETVVKTFDKVAT